MERVGDAYGKALGESLTQASHLLYAFVAFGIVLGVVICCAMIWSGTRVPKAKPFDPDKERRDDDDVDVDGRSGYFTGD